MSMTTNSFHGLRRQPFQKRRESSLGRRDISFGTVELIPYISEITPQRRRVCFCIALGLSDIGAAGRPDSHQAFSRQYPDGRHHGVRRDPMLSREVSIRRKSRTRGVLAAASYLSAESVRDQLLSGLALKIGHILSVPASVLRHPMTHSAYWCEYCLKTVNRLTTVMVAYSRPEAPSDTGDSFEPFA